MTRVLFAAVATLLFVTPVSLRPLALPSPPPAAGGARAPAPPAEPPAPQPSAAAQRILAEAAERLQAQKPLEALQAAERARAAAREGADPAGEAQAHALRARALEAANRAGEALVAWRDAAAACERAGDGPGRVEALAAAGLLLVRPNPAEADALFTVAVAAGRAEAMRPLAAAQALYAAASALFRQRRLAPTLTLAAAALAIRERFAPGSLDLAASLTGVGAVVLQQGQLATAREYFERALGIQEQLDPDSLRVAQSLTNLGVVARNQGDLAATESYYHRALPLFEKLAPRSPMLALCLNNLGALAEEQGNLVRAVEYHRHALALREETAAGSLDLGQSLANLGSVAARQGDLAAATTYYQRALALLAEAAPGSLEVAAVMHSLGLVAADQGNLTAAAEYYRRALAITEGAAPGSLAVATELASLGRTARQQGDLATAGEYHRRALAIRERLAPDSLDVARSMQNLGVLAEKRGMLSEAKSDYQRACDIHRKLAPGSLDLAWILGDLALIARKQGDWIEAERLARQAWDLVQRQAAVVTGDEARQAFGTLTATVGQRLMRAQIALGRPAAAFVTLEEGRARSLQQILAERHLDTSAAPARLQTAYRAAVKARDRAEQTASRASISEALARRALGTMPGGAAEEPAAKRAALEAAARQLAEAQGAYTRARVEAEQAWVEIKKSTPHAYPPSLTLDQARRALPAGVLLAAFSVDEDQTQLFLLRGGRGEAPALSVHAVRITRKALEEQVRQFRLRTTDPNARWAAASRSLYQALFPPAARKAVQGAERLLISPDGPLWEVPFAALVTDTGAPRCLGTAKPITYTQSLMLFARSRQSPSGREMLRLARAVVVGNPLFTQQPEARPAAPLLAAAPTTAPAVRGERASFFEGSAAPAPLPRTAQEAAAIARLYGSVPLLGSGATEAAVRQRMETAEVVHLATHGYLNPAWPMSSGVLLAVAGGTAPSAAWAEETANDGVLQAWEVYSQLKLRAELVVLSACETGRGQNVRGEGIVGLTRALQYAGARTVVASQWSVADDSTATLMVAFHRKLREGLARDEALRQAMIHLQQNPQTAHPYYWAAFVLTGDPGDPHRMPARRAVGSRVNQRPTRARSSRSGSEPGAPLSPIRAPWLGPRQSAPRTLSPASHPRMTGPLDARRADTDVNELTALVSTR
jgi:CHAT domain-containing protein/Tfp pilus assembly protein PilF